jgi:thioredoxin 1
MDLNTQTFEKFIKENEKCVVDFWAPWCGPCKMLAPTLEEACGDANVPLGKVNIDDAGDVAGKFGIMSIPCVILFENGEETNRKIGNVPKESLMEFLG